MMTGIVIGLNTSCQLLPITSVSYETYRQLTAGSRGVGQLAARGHALLQTHDRLKKRRESCCRRDSVTQHFDVGND